MTPIAEPKEGGMNGLHRTALCWVAVLVSAPAVAGSPAPASSATLVAHPLVVVGGSAEDAARFGPQLDAELARRDIRVVGKTCAHDFLARREGGSCSGDEACLAQLARACGASRALYVTVYPYRPRMVLAGKLVRADGLLERSVSNVEVTRPSGRLRPEMVRPGIEKVLTVGLHLETLDLEPLAVAAGAPEGSVPLLAAEGVPAAGPGSTVVPAAVLAPVESPRGASGQRIAAYACLGAGAVALGIGTALHFSAKSDEDAYRATLDPDGQRPPTPAAASAQQALRDKGVPVTLALAAGAALVAAGVTLWVLDPKSPEAARVAVQPVTGGGSLVVAGRF
jgi:hypothetical protein